jgi:hypothetical protein
MAIDPRLIDHAKRILVEADIPQESRARLWDEYHDAGTAQELATRIANFGTPKTRGMLDVKSDFLRWVIRSVRVGRILLTVYVAVRFLRSGNRLNSDEGVERAVIS